MLKIFIKALAFLKPKHNPKDALLLELLKENKRLKLEVKHQNHILGSEIFKLRDELYAERLYNRTQNKEIKENKKEGKCIRYIKVHELSFVQVYI